ncbi:MAG: TIGR02206 family membrane protein, partial [Gammaproteobacteria bacterium]
MTGLPSFVIFGPAHIGALAAIAVLAVSVPLLARQLDKGFQYRLGVLIAWALLLLEISKSVIGVYVYGNSLGLSLPLHLCGIAALLTAWVLWRKSYAAYEIACFWGIAGSVPTLLTPDVAAGFPHLAFFIFFSSHGMIVLGVLYATFVYGYRPRLRSIGKTFLATMILVIVVTPLNLLLDANYM